MEARKRVKERLENLTKLYDERKIVASSKASAISFFSTRFCHSYPEAKTLQSGSAGEFIEEVARNHLINITAIGVRTVGSTENEEITVDYFLTILKKIKENASKVHDIEIISERCSGSFFIDAFGTSFGIAYENVNNIAVRIRPNTGANHDLLINCHYDSQIGTPGASDDAVSCSIMLEVLRVLSESNERLEYGVIFLFNGAEETILQASHGFITQHSWAKSVRAFINLEAAGAGGRELLFQAGPGAPWLLDTYAKNAPHPFAFVLGQELFQAGIIPADTDFRIFRDFGELSGLDMAYIHNGYVYHTAYDEPKRIPKGCIQRSGENLLAIVKAIANSRYLAKPSAFKKDSLVFFDVYGFFMITYPSSFGLVLNCAACAIVIFGVISKIILNQDKKYTKLFVIGFSTQFLALIFTLSICLLIAHILTNIGKTLTWYTNSWLIIPLYVCPAISALTMTHFASKQLISKNTNNYQMEEAVFEATTFLFTIPLFATTLLRFDSSAILLLTIVPPLVVKIHGSAFVTNQTGNGNSKELLKRICALHILSTLIPVCLIIYIEYVIFSFFVPLFGRSGDMISPEYVIAFLAGFFTYYTFSYQMSLIYLTKGALKLPLTLMGVFGFGCFLIFFTQLGSPFSMDTENPSIQRLIIQHSSIEDHRENSSLFNKTGFWVSPLDYHSSENMYKLPMLDGALPVTCNEEQPYCGLPFYLPTKHIIKNTFWINGNKPAFKHSIHLENWKTVQEDGATKLFFKLTGSDRRVIMLRTKTGVELTGWSISGEKKPAINSDSKHYFIFYAYGKKPSKPFEFWCKFKNNSKLIDKFVDIAIASHDILDEKSFSTSLTMLVNTLPEVISPMIVSSDLHLYSF
ncbi:DgyrCDS4869 [Dimorphilus gyrociliatus]|uniref:DgyrCDS4869 n=1 Tax=Dimorphilus gyrociliatus TaxID=2664684 RepID=A0A7I8VKG7_9ANNE|nr:DgyrCDS4869 [Dimorphilus gyrociliatus]